MLLVTVVTVYVYEDISKEPAKINLHLSDNQIILFIEIVLTNEHIYDGLPIAKLNKKQENN